jgi:hypothetical protein
MSFSSTGLIIIGVILLLGVLLWRATGKSVRIRNSKGNIIAGNVVGSATQDYKGETVIGSNSGSNIGAKDVITWLIAIAGAIITALGVYHAWLGSH